MAANFKLSVHRNSDSLHLKLIGDFDGTSAHELITVLKRYRSRTSRVFIHTSSLREVYQFGVNVLRTNLKALKGKPLTLLFTGKHASRMAPESPMPLNLTISIIPPVAQPAKPASALSSEGKE